VHTTGQASALLPACSVLVLAVKPQILKSVIEPLAAAVQQHQPLIVSVAAGVSAESIDRWLGGNTAIVRTMPNTPALVQTGATGLFANDRLSDALRETIDAMFKSIGVTVWVEREDDLHAVTAAGGSAPAYFFRFMEAMVKAAQTQGLTEQQALQLIAQTCLGAAKMVQQTGEAPDALKRRVMSPKGTTEQAILRFDGGGLDALVQSAMDACHQRSVELSRELDQ
jgi:pyrroline-5-carboxylate reductase